MDARELSKVFAESVFPVTIFYGALAFLGILGNVSVLYVYKRKYSYGNFKILVMCLAVTDVVSCLFVFPCEIVGHRVWFSYPKSAAWFCKMKTAIGGISVLTSSSVLLLISVDRFRKVCRPFGWQIKPRYTVYLCFLSLVISVVLTLPVPILFGIQTQNITYAGQVLKIFSCQNDDLYKNTDWMTIYLATMYYMPIVAFMFTTSVLYGLILRRIFSGKLLLDAAQFKHISKPKENVCDDLKQSVLSSNVTPDCTNTLEMDESDEESLKTKKDGKSKLTVQVIQPGSTSLAEAECPIQGAQNTGSLSQDGTHYHTIITKQAKTLPSVVADTDNGTWNNRKAAKTKPRSKGSRRRVTRKTAIMLTVTLIFYATIIVYIGVFLLVLRKRHIYELASTKTVVILVLCWRIYFINHVINPLVYGLLDKRFRQAVSNMFCLCDF